jgi:putative endonuclease
MAEHNDLGKIGEDLALAFLTQKGFLLRERNYRFARAEIDLIMFHEDDLVFIEVKTRQTAEIGEPYLSVTKSKQKQLIKAAHAYILSKDLDVNARFDVVSIVHNSYRTNIEHIVDAFTP